MRGLSPHPNPLSGEKEQPLVTFVKLARLGAEFRLRFAGTLGAFLPLRWGEGRGEGGKRSDERGDHRII